MLNVFHCVFIVVIRGQQHQQQQQRLRIIIMESIAFEDARIVNVSGKMAQMKVQKQSANLMQMQIQHQVQRKQVRWLNANLISEKIC